MAKVTVHRGVTIAPKNTYHSFRADITLSDIDTEGDVDKQIKDSLVVAAELSSALEEPLAQDAADVSALSIEGMGLTKQYNQFIVDDKAWKKSVVAEVKKLQKLVDEFGPKK